MSNKKIIELDAASQINNDALFVLSQLVGANQKTLKATLAQMQAVFGNVPIETVLTTPVSIASFSDGGDNIPLKALKVLVTAQQAGSGTPAPDNVRAISGWSACNLSATGKNLLHTTFSGWEETANGIKITTPSSGSYVSDLFLGKLNLGSYCVKDFQGGSNTTHQLVLYKNNTVFAYVTTDLATFTVTDINDNYRVRVYVYSGNTDQYIQPVLTEGSSISTYEPFGTTHNIPFNTTVYGGVLDVLSGVLKVTHGIVDLGDLTWISEESTISGQARAVNTEVSPLGAKYNQIPLCSQFVGVQPKGYRDFNDGEVGFSNSEAQPFIRVRSTIFAGKTDAEIKSLLNGVQFVYELATPTVIQLTPTEVKTILGQNNIFANCGDIDTLVYFNNNANEISDLVVAYVGDITNLYATLATGNTSLTISNAAIKTTSTIDIYTDGNVDYNTVTVTEGQIVITFDAQASDVKVKVRLS